MNIVAEEKKHLEYILEKINKKLTQTEDKLSANADDMETMNDYFWDNYTEFDEYGYEMYDNKQAMKTRLTQQDEYKKERKRYRKMLDAPYFGRVDFCYDGEDDSETYYIGIGSLAEGRASTPLIFDWRAPVSGLFYDYDKGPGSFEAPAGTMEGEITRKRQYKIRHGKLLFALENEMSIDDDILQQTLAEHADAKLKSIVTTIQKEQNSIIRDTTHRILAVQGCAGSGKTSVALHRIAYLLYHNREKLEAAQVLVLSPNSIFGDYISRILPELGENNVFEMTFDDFAYRELREFGEAEDRYDELERELSGINLDGAACKRTKAYVEELNEFVLQLEWEVVELKDFEHKKMFMNVEQVSKLFYEKFSDVPIFARMKRIGEYLIDEEETLRDRNMDDEEKAVIYEKLNRMYIATNTKELYQQFLKNSGRDFEIFKDGVIPYEDVYPLLYLKYATQELPRLRAVKHLVIDEMQDYSYLQYLIIQKLFHCPMTILGDRAQTMAETARDVLHFLPKIFGNDVYCVSLNKSYRSTSEITAYAESLVLEAKNGKNTETSTEQVERHGEVPKVQCFTAESDMYAAISRQIQEQSEMSTIAVLCQDAAQAAEACIRLKEVWTRGEEEITLLTRDSMKFAPGISVMPFYLAKGLEFDAVFVPNVEKYTTPLKKQALYINATRALHVLKLYEISEVESEYSLNTRFAMNAGRLITNIIDQIKEAQLKLGYAYETIRLYFPLESLNAILETDYNSIEKLLEALRCNEQLKTSILGELRFFSHEGRVEVRIPPKGSEYVHSNVPEPMFLKKLLQLFGENHHLTIEQIQACFAAVDQKYVCEKMKPGSDFDYVIYFEDKQIDAYYYCVKMEMGHTIYHRFIKEDYDRLM